MTDNSTSINFDLSLVYNSWRAFRRGKKPSRSIIEFEYNLEDNLLGLAEDLTNGTYKHGGYKIKEVFDPKRRRIAVASVRDRVVHRLVYDSAMPIVDRRLDYDVWSCRPGKGLHKAIQRTKYLLHKYPEATVWRADVAKFFDNVDHEICFSLLKKYNLDERILWLFRLIIDSYNYDSGRGIAIGNLTSQLVANVYLGEFDHFVRQYVNPFGYVRYGDDFLLFLSDKGKIQKAVDFLKRELKLELHKTNNAILKPRRGVHFLGARIFSSGSAISKRTWQRAAIKINESNRSSYYSLVHQVGSRRQQLCWIYML